MPIGPNTPRLDRAARLAAVLFAPCLTLTALAAPVRIIPDQPNEVAFAPQLTKFIRFVIRANSSAQPCLDELEVYGPAGEANLALASAGAKATASSCLAGYALHQIAHLNDGRYGNDFSWIAATGGEEWAQIELSKSTEVSRVVFSRDRSGRYADRVPTSLEVLLSNDGKTWQSIMKVSGVAAPATGGGSSGRSQTVSIQPHHARHVRLTVLGTNDGSPPRLSEIELYGPRRSPNLALRENGVRVEVSSRGKGDPTHLLDGRLVGDAAWEAARPNRQWVQLELPRRTEITRVVLFGDRGGKAPRGMPNAFEVSLSLDGRRWKIVAERGKGLVPPPPPLLRGLVAAGAKPVDKGHPRAGARGHEVDLNAPRTDELGFANLALAKTARPAASSLLPGYPDRHRIEFLTDGKLGNGHSWISNGEPSWAEVELGDTYWVYKVALGSDTSQQHTDRAATHFAVLAATEYDQDSNAETWRTVARQTGGPPLHTRTELKFRPVQARWIRVAISAANQSACRVDELEVYGQKKRLPLDKLGPLPEHPAPLSHDTYGQLLRAAFLAEEHAWLKTFGRADVDPRLTDYLRVMEYPRHVADDRLPLPPLSSEPRLDGKLDDACWQLASRGIVRVAKPEDFAGGPLVDHVLYAGRTGEHLLLGLRVDRLLSAHVAVVSADDWRGCGVVAVTADGLVFNTYEPGEGGRAELTESLPVEGALSDDLTACELRLPLKLFPNCEQRGLRVGLGMGGRHTRPEGHAVHLVPSSLSLAEVGACKDGVCTVRLIACGEAVKLRGNHPGLPTALAEGKTKTVALRVELGPIGPQLELALDDSVDEFLLHLFRYDPTARALAQAAHLSDRLGREGVSVSADRKQLAVLAGRHARLVAAAPDLAAERELFFEARAAQRRLFLRDPRLGPLGKILCVKRHNFEPSHNYSVILDSRGGPGGSVDLLEIPRIDGRLDPGAATVRELFDSGNGIARNPVASPDCNRVYFGYCKAKGDYYHLYSVKPDGNDPRQLTDGPFHDYWPCPLPDGGLAFISTRCRARFLCWRPQAAVLFRMDADGGNARPLSHANLTEWAPSVMEDGRLIWTRSEYQDKGADHGHTLWSIRPDGTHPELLYGNDLVQPNGFANGREVPGADELCAVAMSHFGDLNGPLVLLDRSKGPFDPEAITTLTPEVPWPGTWPTEECFRDPVPISSDHILCAHSPRDRRFELYVVDRFGNREVLYADPSISVLCPTPFAERTLPPAFPGRADMVDGANGEGEGELFLTDVYQGLAPRVRRGQVKWLRVCQEVRADLERLPTGEYRSDHPVFQDWYATPVHKVSGPFGWPSYVAKASWGLVPVNDDGSAHFTVPAGKVLYFDVLDENYNELQRMRSVVQLQPGEKRSCIGCHEHRQMAPPVDTFPEAQSLQERRVAAWEGKPFAFEQVVQPVLDKHCIRCHGPEDARGLNLTGALDRDKVPASYRTLISQGLVHHFDWGYKTSPEKAEPLTFGTLKSKLIHVLEAGHKGVALSTDDTLRLKTWIDLSCPLWPDYVNRLERPGPNAKVARAE